MALQIVAATPKHLPELLAIEALCFLTDRLSKRSFQRWLSRGMLNVALVDGVVAGYGLVIAQRRADVARLYSLAVAPGYQGQGIARALINALEAQAIACGKQVLRLEVAKKNHSAQALYQRLGYSKFGEYQDYYQDHDDAIRMHKQLIDAS